VRRHEVGHRQRGERRAGERRRHAPAVERQHQRERQADDRRRARRAVERVGHERSGERTEAGEHGHREPAARAAGEGPHPEAGQKRHGEGRREESLRRIADAAQPRDEVGERPVERPVRAHRDESRGDRDQGEQQ